ncbi:MAG: TrkA family potassium uptake protein [Candidatus Nanopelagicales bacterium]
MTSVLRLPARRLTPLGSILVRVGIAIACLVLTAVIVYIERAGYRDVTGDPISWLDAFYYATVTLSTTGYGDITPYTDLARLTNTLLITPLRFVFLIVLVGTTVEVLTTRSRDEFRANRWRKRVDAHTVVVGFGVTGRSAVQALVDQGTPAAQIVVVDRSAEAIEEAAAFGCVGVTGDATREDVLRTAEVGKARRVVVAADHDDTAVLVVLTARRLTTSATIVASARESQNIAVLRQSGASTVIPTAESAGRMLGLSLASPVAGRIVEDLLEPVQGLEIVERAVAPAELGVPPQSLLEHGTVVLAVVRGGEVHRFDHGTVNLLQKDDRLVVIRSSSADGVRPHGTAY